VKLPSKYNPRDKTIIFSDFMFLNNSAGVPAGAKRLKSEGCQRQFSLQGVWGTFPNKRKCNTFTLLARPLNYGNSSAFYLQFNFCLTPVHDYMILFYHSKHSMNRVADKKYSKGGALHDD